MPDSVLIPDAAAVGITITRRDERPGGTTTDYYCIGGPNYRDQGTWVQVTTADSDATKLTAIQTALS